MLKHNTLITTSLLSLSLISINGCSNAPLLPGSFPTTSIFKGAYKPANNVAMVLPEGKWHMISNGRIIRFTILNNNGTYSLQSRGFSNTPSTPLAFDGNTGEIQFTRKLTIPSSPNRPTYLLEQNYTGYLMVYGKNNGVPDYKWRMAGTFTSISPKLHRPTNGWYATRPRQ